ncbi:hypothetical protein RHMOL_Rhmol07G0227100 [Rhododendron molle]|uniref:Uncharacterized protein n=1 Tax=Rhododendron molle TaxID=49168 RepID=A0ACC0N5J6_RHOML|nr:hypothetical protein RHMOL_Rhmol07G0227100 [Rhododendron molle]
MHSPKSASFKHVWKSWEVLGTNKEPNLPSAILIASSSGKSPCHLRRMRILFGSNTATGEHMHTSSSGSLEVDNIDALLDNDADVQKLVHPLGCVKKRRVDGSTTKKSKGKKGTMGSRLKACMQQICDSTDSASSPSSVHRAALDILTIKECGEKLLLLPEFDIDPTLWIKAHNPFRDVRTRTFFMTSPDGIRRYHFITQELQRVEAAEL